MTYTPSPIKHLGSINHELQSQKQLNMNIYRCSVQTQKTVSYRILKEETIWTRTWDPLVVSPCVKQRDGIRQRVNDGVPRTVGVVHTPHGASLRPPQGRWPGPQHGKSRWIRKT
jgi:hypothetical protein